MNASLIGYFQLRSRTLYLGHAQQLASSHGRLEVSHPSCLLPFCLKYLSPITSTCRKLTNSFKYAPKWHPFLEAFPALYTHSPSNHADTTSWPSDLFIILPCVDGYLCMTGLSTQKAIIICVTHGPSPWRTILKLTH